MKKSIAFFLTIVTLVVCVYCTVTRQKQEPKKDLHISELQAPPRLLKPVPGIKLEEPKPVEAEEYALYDAAEAGPEVDKFGTHDNTESYKFIEENKFQSALLKPLSTFSIDVDRASYSNVRRFIEGGSLPPPAAVRIEEMINYFTYDYPQPKDHHPFAVSMEVSKAPWNELHQIVHIGIQGKNLPTAQLPSSNLVFLIDVSGSMDEPNKLPLVKESLRMLVNTLRERDHVSMVVYAGAAGTVLEPTPGSEKRKILEALEELHAGGSTAGAEGLRLAYKKARENFNKSGNNRVIIATDGDFNVGESSDEAMEELITEEKEDGIYLTVLGFGMGNYKDSKMETLADKGNGNYAYIDNISEARKTLVNEFAGTLFTIAKDVKIQVEFNPSKVQAYRLIGYENRVMADEDFNNDKKDAGELGSGHTVTALYEVIPAGVESKFFNIDELKYQRPKEQSQVVKSDELMTLKLRYKNPTSVASKLIQHTLTPDAVSVAEASKNLRWSVSVAAFGMILKESEYINHYPVDKLVVLAESAKGSDTEGYRSEFISMVKSFSSMARK
jgi:Ca-activated chloride channel homolog